MAGAARLSWPRPSIRSSSSRRARMPSRTGCSTRSSRPIAPIRRSGRRWKTPMLPPPPRSARDWPKPRGADSGPAGATRSAPSWHGRQRNEPPSQGSVAARLVPEHTQANGDRRRLAGAVASARREAVAPAIAADCCAGGRARQWFGRDFRPRQSAAPRRNARKSSDAGRAPAGGTSRRRARG